MQAASQPTAPIGPPLPRLDAAQGERLARLRLVFAHQELGGEILRGAREASLRLLGRPLQAVPLASTSPLPPGTWSDVRVGQDGDPASKLAHLEELVAGHYADSADVLLFKLSAADVLPESEPLRLLDAIYRSFERIHTLLPTLRVVPATVPLQRRAHGVRAAMRRALGRETDSARANATREQLNALLRDAFQGWPLFDVAALESPALGEPALDESLTFDGEHLGTRGRLALGGALLAFAATLPLRGPA